MDRLVADGEENNRKHLEKRELLCPKCWHQSLLKTGFAQAYSVSCSNCGYVEVYVD